MRDKRDLLFSLRSLWEAMSNFHRIFWGEVKLITTLKEKKGGRRRLKEEFESFQEIIEELGVIDIILGEGWFMWNNKISGDRHIASILD